MIIYIMEKNANDYVLISGSTDCSVILACGLLINNNGVYRFDGYKNYFIDSVVQNSANQGRLIIKLNGKDGRNVVLTGVYVQQGETNGVPYENEASSGRGAGAHWFSANLSTGFSYDKQSVIIHEIHQHKENNDSWESTMIQDTSIKSIMILIVGYVQ